MKFFRRFFKLPLRIQGALWGVICAGLLLLGSNLHFTDGLERATWDALFKARGPRYPSPKVAIVVFDDDTAARYSTSWPPPRRLYSQLIRRLQHFGARTIAFDILFPVSSGRAAEDAKFARVCAQNGRVVHAAAFPVQSDSGQFMSLVRRPSNSSEPLPRFQISDRQAQCKTAMSGFSALPALQNGAAAIGHVVVFPEISDGTLRRIPHIIRYKGQVFPSLALAAAAHSMGLKPLDIVAERDGISLGNRHISIDAHGETLINWIGANESFSTYSFNRVLSDAPGERLPDDAFRDRIVLVGTTLAGAWEHHPTPFSPSQPAVELQANAIDDILTNRLLREMPMFAQIGLLLSLSVAVGLLNGGRNARFSVAATLAIMLMMWMAALFVFRSHNFYWPLGTPLLSVLATSICCVGFQQLRDSVALKIAEERYALAVRGANDGIWDWNLETDSIYYGPRWKEMLGWSENEISNRPDEWFGRVHAGDLEMVRRHLDEHLEGKSPQFQCEFRMRQRDESYRWVLARGLMVRDRNDRPSRMAGSLTDINDRRHAEAKLLEQALSDELTGLPNRALFLDRLRRAIARSRRLENYSFAVLFLDLDRFKVVNDSLGHLVGDEMLQIVARRLETCLRPGDTVARMGGDEFTMLLDDVGDAADALLVAERVQSTLHPVLQLDGHSFSTSASIGIAVATSAAGSDGRPRPRYEHAEALLRDADTAMYRAKALGRARHVVFDEEMHRHAMAQLRLETELQRALERENFRVLYQPIVDLQANRVSGFEALVRWDDPERGLVPPSEFIAFAEETGLIIALDQWVLREACRQTRLWQTRLDREDITISVNLSSKQFSQAGLVHIVEETLRDTELRAECLRLEITESVIMQNAEASAQMLEQLQKLGVRLSIDDFGTGYSSLSYLHQFPLDVLKVDRSFVSRIDRDGGNAEIVETIVNLANSLEMKVVAEGIETEEQCKHLCDLGCEFGQGFLFSRPVDATRAGELLIAAPHWGCDGDNEDSCADEDK